MDHFAVYAPISAPPDAETFELFAPGAEVVEEAGVTVVSWPDVTVTITVLPRAELMPHLQGLIGWVKKNGGSPALATRVMHTTGVFGCVIDPQLDDKSFSLVSGLADAASGFAFFRNTLVSRDRDLMKDGLELPSAARVATRATVLLACAARALLEDDAGKAEEADAQVLCDEIAEWVASDPARLDELEDDEQVLLDAKMGELDPQERIDRVWAAESACAMLWALGVYELPAFTVTEHPYQLCKLAGVRGTLHPKLASPSLRSMEELETMRTRYTAIHWRLVERRLHPDETIDFVTFAEKGAWLAPFDPAGLPLLGRDLAVDDVGTATSVTRERQRGLNWLVGVHPEFSSVDTPT